MTLLLIVLYITFIGLGLPDPVLGSLWTDISATIGTSSDMMGYINLVVIAGTAISALIVSIFPKYMKTIPVIILSIAFTIIGLIGISFAQNMIWIFLFAIPLGLGGGGVDAVINNYVIIHYKPKYVTWLHCFWGIGGVGGPLLALLGSTWREGLQFVSIAILSVLLVFIVTLPVWAKKRQLGETELSIDERSRKLGVKSALKTPLILVGCMCFFFMVSIEGTVFTWASSYMRESLLINKETASIVISAFMGSYIVGRLILGFLTNYFSAKSLIRAGLVIMAIGALMGLTPHSGVFIASIIILALGLCIMYPTFSRENPHRYGLEKNQAVTAIQVVACNIGSATMPLFVSLFLRIDGLTINIYPYFPLIFTLGLAACSELFNFKFKKVLAEREHLLRPEEASGV